MDKMMRKARLQYWVDAHRNAQSVGLANSNGFRNRAFRSRCSTTGNRHAGDLILRRVHYFTPCYSSAIEKAGQTGRGMVN